ncbi:hypothetical protein EBU99_05725 [bacterium]|nr:hypothetical protein [bacterium]
MNKLNRFFEAGLQLEKWHGARNDFIFVRVPDFVSALKLPCTADTIALCSEAICERSEGLGADGLVLWDIDGNGRASAAIWNSDGTRAQTCGNALRCLGSLLFANLFWSGSEALEIRALGISNANITASEKVFARLISVANEEKQTPDTQSPAATLYEAQVDMGSVLEARVFAPEEIFSGVPLLQSQQQLLRSSLLNAVFVQLANPHLVLILKQMSFSSFSNGIITEIGSAAQSSAVRAGLKIPECNIGFVELPKQWDARINASGVGAQQPLNAVVYERGAGLTQCCGSGGCAMKVALDHIEIEGRHPSLPLPLRMPGGTIRISGNQERLLLTGPAVCVGAIRVLS